LKQQEKRREKKRKEKTRDPFFVLGIAIPK